MFSNLYCLTLQYVSRFFNQESEELIRDYQRQLIEAAERLNHSELQRQEHVESLEKDAEVLRAQLTDNAAALASMSAKIQHFESREVDELADLRRKVADLETLLAMNEEERNDADAMFAKVWETKLYFSLQNERLFFLVCPPRNS
jgi:chromosome segregation ATPase